MGRFPAITTSSGGFSRGARTAAAPARSVCAPVWPRCSAVTRTCHRLEPVRAHDEQVLIDYIVGRDWRDQLRINAHRGAGSGELCPCAVFVEHTEDEPFECGCRRTPKFGNSEECLPRTSRFPSLAPLEHARPQRRRQPLHHSRRAGIAIWCRKGRVEARPSRLRHRTVSRH